MCVRVIFPYDTAASTEPDQQAHTQGRKRPTHARALAAAKLTGRDQVPSLTWSMERAPRPQSSAVSLEAASRLRRSRWGPVSRRERRRWRRKSRRRRRRRGDRRRRIARRRLPRPRRREERAWTTSWQPSLHLPKLTRSRARSCRFRCCRPRRRSDTPHVPLTASTVPSPLSRTQNLDG